MLCAPSTTHSTPILIIVQVLFDITERRPCISEPVAPTPRTAAFEHARSKAGVHVGGGGGPRKKSIFAQRFDAIAGANGSTGEDTRSSGGFTASSAPPRRAAAANQARQQEKLSASNTQRSDGGDATSQGANRLIEDRSTPGVPNTDAVEDEVQEENRRRVLRMSRNEIEEAHDEIKRMFSPETLRFLQKKVAATSKGDAGAARSAANTGGGADKPTSAPMDSYEPAVAAGTTANHLPASQHPLSGSATDLAVEARRKGWVNMEVVEDAKLKWTTDVSPEEREEEMRRNPIRKTEVRFDLTGKIVPLGADIAPTAGLHHHADFPELPGYAHSNPSNLF